MELKVAVDGVERCISGLTEETTCAQIIYALAHATGQKGRFVLVEKYRDSERSLAPTDRPLEMLKKWDEPSQFVVYVLKRLDNSSSSTVTDSFSLKSTLDNSSQSLFPNNFPQEPPLLFNPERSSSPIAKSLQQDQYPAIQPTSTFKPLSTKALNYEMPKSSSDASFRPMILGLPRASYAVENGGPHHYYSASSVSQGGSLRHRPPPPAYHEVIEQRYNSLSRGCTPFAIPRPALWHPTANVATDNVDANLVKGAPDQQQPGDNGAANTANLTPAELERLIENQQSVIEKQKTLLLQLDTSTADADQRELLQLERQQANLRLVLHPLRTRDIPGLLKEEKSELERIRASIVELQQKIDKISQDLNEQSLLEIKLSEQVTAMEREVADLEGSASTIDDVLDSPMREMLIS